MSMRLTESRLLRIIREEINEMAQVMAPVRGATFVRDPVTGEWVLSGVSDKEGQGAERARAAAASRKKMKDDPMAGYLGKEPGAYGVAQAKAEMDAAWAAYVEAEAEWYAATRAADAADNGE